MESKDAEVNLTQKQQQRLENRLQSPNAQTLLRQNPFYNLLFIIIKLKTWPALLIIIPIMLTLSNAYLPLMYKWFERYRSEQAGEGRVEFYDATNLMKSEDAVLLDSSSFPAETGALASIMADRSGGHGRTDWMQHCSSAKECQARFISEQNASVVAYMNYSRSTDGGRANLGLKCHRAKGSNRKCAYLYQLMSQSISQTSRPGEVFKEVQFFTITLQRSIGASRDNNATKKFPDIPLAKSFCADLFRRHPKLFQSIIDMFVTISLGSSTLGLNFYFFLATLPAIRAIKADGFLQKLVRIGLSPSLYWSAIWLLTVAECFLVSVVYTLSLFLQCPGFYRAETIPNVWTFVFFYFISLAAVTLLLEMLIFSLAAISMLSLAIAVGLMFAFHFDDQLVHMLPNLWYVLPQISAKRYIVAYLTSDVVLRTTESNPVIEPHYGSQLVAIVLTALLLGFVVSYLDCCLSTGNGLFLPFYFPWSIRFWSPSHVKAGDQFTFNLFKPDPEPHIEKVVGFVPSIKIQRVFKSYTDLCLSELRVLNGVSCEIFKNQITALIGHNGAGKSTLVKVITGEESLDGGAAYIDGIKVTDPLDRLALRGRVTICPQFDVLCDELTVSESLQVILNCSGVCIDNQEEKARNMLRRLGLGDKESVKTSELSGGQKRMLNVILALVGDPQVVFLDEPTSGLDPVSRRQLWQLLQEEKVGRSIVLCTQFMDEADVLADRKIFLCGGEIICAGSSMFLKRAFGCCFTLNVSLKSKADAQKVVSRLNAVKVKSLIEAELKFEVPAAKPDLLIEAVRALESSPEIKGFVLSQANLDDIFTKLSGVSSFEIMEAFQCGELYKFYDKSNHDALAVDFAGQSQSMEQMQSSVFKQFTALFRTNLYRQTRSVSNIFSRFLIPAMFLTVIWFSVMNRYGSIGPKSHRKPKAVSNYLNSKFHLSATKSFQNYVMNYICIHKETESLANTSSCSNLTFTRKGNFILMSQPASIKLRDFVSQNSTILALQQACYLGSKSVLRGCVIYYASSWDKSEPNGARELAVGWLEYDTNPVDTVHVYAKAFVLFSALFGGANDSYDPDNAVSLVRPLSQFNFLSSHAEIFWLLVAFTLFPVSYLSDPIEDVISRVRTHMKTMGMTDLAYWVNTFVLHWLQYIFCFAKSVGLMCIWSRYRNAYFILACLPPFLLGTVTNQMTVYTLAAFSRRENPVVFVFCNCYAVFLPVILGTLGMNKAVLMLICLIPPLAPIALIYYSVLLATYSLEYYNVEAFSQIPNLNEINWSSAFILTSLLVMPIHICLMICTIVVVERSESIREWFFRECFRDGKLFAIFRKQTPITKDPEASKAADRVLQSRRNPSNMLEVRQLHKTYPNGVKAVRGTTFDTIPGETFGLLGVGGAGKSTIMSVIIGQEAPSSGECEVRVKSKGGDAWQTGASCALTGTIGYCPQYNPLFDKVTVAEHMSLYADIRGVPAAVASRQVMSLIQGLGLQENRNQYAGDLSSGNKRRLCLAIALLGDPKLVLIDEASTGVDPENKRFIWNVIRGMLNDQRSVVVTTHSMEEVEALCCRVGIMNKGRMITIETVQHLQSLHGDAYTLEALVPHESIEKLTTERKAAIKAAVSSQFKGAVLMEDLSLCVQFCIPKNSVNRLSDALQWLADNRSRLGLEYCSIYQMSLDQAFVKLVKHFDKALDSGEVHPQAEL